MFFVLYHAVIIPVSKLSWNLIYKVSDFLSWLVGRVFRYRRNVIDQNLKRSFPEKSTDEIKAIRKNFYRHFTDTWMETLKLFSIRKEEAIERCKLRNPEFLEQFHGQHVMVVLGHHNNWEMVAVAVAPQIKHTPIAIYSPVKNDFFDKKMLKSRSKFGLRMIPKRKAKKSIVDKDDRESIVFFVADQSGLTSKRVYWMPFLNQDTAVVAGPERYAKMLNAPVAFLEVVKTRRGHYEMEFSLLTANPEETEPGEITVRHVRKLESIIREHPSYWLWTHKRWKKGRLPDNQIPFDLASIEGKIEQENSMTS